MRRTNPTSRGSKNKRRSSSGVSLTELLVACILLVACMAVIAELMVAITRTTTRLSNREECLITVRAAVQRVLATVRSSHSFDDEFQPTSGGAPPGWSTPPWRASEQTLIVQLYPSNQTDGIVGFEMHPIQGSTNSKPVFVMNLNTLVFQVVDDVDKPGEFLLQSMLYDSNGIAIYGSPQTNATGLINTASPGLPPPTFSYFKRDTTGGIVPIAISEIVDKTQIRGVTMDLKVRKSGQNPNHQQTMCIRTEAFPASQ